MSPKRPDRASGFGVGLLFVVVMNAVLIGLFFDKAWIPSDDGHYVHVADRLTNGQVLNVDVEEFHPGYVHFIHAVSLKSFGDEIVSLRYPLMALLLLQSLLMFAIFRPAGPSTATMAAMTMSAIGAFQIANPTTSLYALGATVALVAVVMRTTPETRHRAIAMGVLVGMVFMFRQLTAVFVVMGLLGFLFTEERTAESEATSRGFGLVRAVIGITIVGLVGYLLRSTDFSAGILFGLWPLLILIWALGHPTMQNRSAVRLLSGLGFGAALSALPIVGYHMLYGSLAAWVSDVLVRSLSVTNLEHIRVGRYVYTVVISLATPLIRLSPVAGANALYWIALIFAAFIAGALLVHRIRKLPQSAGIPTSWALPFIGVFYALVSVFNQIPYYLYLSAALSIVSMLWMIAGPGTASGVHAASRTVRNASAAAGALCIIAIAFHAGQPYTRTISEIVAGDRATLVKSGLPRMGLWVAPDEERQLGELLQVIERETGPDDAIFTVPNNAELYFLSKRTNPFRLFNPTISLIDEEDTTDFVEDFERVAPRLIVHDTASRYNIDRTADLVERLTSDFEVVARIERYVVFARR